MKRIFYNFPANTDKYVLPNKLKAMAESGATANDYLAINSGKWELIKPDNINPAMVKCYKIAQHQVFPDNDNLSHDEVFALLLRHREIIEGFTQHQCTTILIQGMEHRKDMVENLCRSLNYNEILWMDEPDTEYALIDIDNIDTSVVTPSKTTAKQPEIAEVLDKPKEPDYKEDITLVIPYMKDSPERERNLYLVLNDLVNNDFKIMLVESGKERTFKALNAKQNHQIEYHFLQQKDNVFHRTKVINFGIVAASTKAIAIYDVDVIVPAEKLINATAMIVEGAAKIVYPYAGRFLNIDAEAYKIGLLKPVSIVAEMSWGGCVVLDRQAYIESGLENENIISWGYEDVERYERCATKFAYKVVRLAGDLYHLQHHSNENSVETNPHLEKNKKEYEKVRGMIPRELYEYVNTWEWKKQALSQLKKQTKDIQKDKKAEVKQKEAEHESISNIGLESKIKVRHKPKTDAITDKHEYSVSVIVPTYNDSEFLLEALQSIDKQKGINTEIVIVDDCSTKPFPADVWEFIQSRKNIKLIRNEINYQLSGSRNKGIEAARFDFIICLDADDYFVHEKALFLMADTLTKQKCDIAYGNMADKDIKSVVFPQKEVNQKAFEAGNPIFQSSMFRRSIWQKANGYTMRPHPHYEDYNFWAKCLAAGAKFQYVESLVYFKRWRGDSMLMKLDKDGKVFKKLALDGVFENLIIEPKRQKK